MEHQVPDLLLPVGPHFFTPDALRTAVNAATLDLPAGHTNVLAGTVDSLGAKVVLVVGSKDGAWRIQSAFAHDWTGHNTFGAAGSYSW